MHKSHLRDTTWGQTQLNILQPAKISPLRHYLKTDSSISSSVHKFHLWDTTWGQPLLNILQPAKISPLRHYLKTDSSISSSVHKSHLRHYLRKTAKYPPACTNVTSETLPEDRQLNILKRAQILLLRTDSSISSSVHKSHLRHYLRTDSSISSSVHKSHLWDTTWGQPRLNILQHSQI